MRKNDIDVEMTESDTLRKNNKTSSTMILHSGGIKGNVDGGKNNILVAKSSLTFDQKTKANVQTPLPSSCILGLELLGIRGLLGTLIVMTIGGLMLFAYSSFNEQQWYILLVAIGAFLLPASFIYQIRKQVKMLIDSVKNKRFDLSVNPDSQEQYENREIRTSITQRVSVATKLAGSQYLSIYDPNGKYYLTKTYISEVVEYGLLVFNITVYNCNFPIEVTVTFYFVLLLEAIGVAIDTVWTINYGITVSRRNNKVMADIVLDFLASLVPVLIMYFVYGLIFTKEEFIQLAVIPAVFALFKLQEIVDAVIRERGAIYLSRYKEKYVKTRHKVHRLSFFSSLKKVVDEDKNLNVSIEQMKHTPWIIHFSFVVTVVLYIIFLATQIIAQLATFGTVNCSIQVSPEIWNGCAVKVQYCKNLFEPTCNCAVIEIESHNMTMLPTSTFAMHALKNMIINNGPLSFVQEDIGKLKKLSSYHRRMFAED
eukprot:g2277.t1